MSGFNELFAEAWSYAFTEEQIVALWREAVADEEKRLIEDHPE